jgi:ATP-binding cassette subfamily C protein EexD
MLVASWKGFTNAKSQFLRLNDLFTRIPETSQPMPLPKPQGSLSVQQLVVAPPASQKIIAQGISLELNRGQILGIIGPSASGKSSIARALLGIWPSVGGKVRFDGVDIASWDRKELGQYIGSLPQNIELFEGTISENISRFKSGTPDTVIAAAKAAGVHDLILGLTQGYDTHVDSSGGALSGGQRQRIGLARALYDDPPLIVLDEPNSNLDDQGEKALRTAMVAAAAKGSILIVITHRTNLLSKVDKVLVMKDGKAQQYGPRDEVFAKFARTSK